MEKPGERSLSEPFTFRYPGRELLTSDLLLSERPNLGDLYVYDICLTTGTLLYLCSGGLGVTKEPYIVDMHRFLKSSTSVKSIRSVFDEEMRGSFTRRRFQKLREEFNEDPRRWEFSTAKSAKLYLLWAGGGFKHRYRGRGYDAPYSPTSLNYDSIALASRQSREKDLLFRKEDIFTFSESLINDNVFVHMYFPAEYGIYGAGFLWNERKLLQYVRVIRELGSLGHKVCVSGLFERRGRVFRDYRNLFPEFDHVVVPGFKVSELTFEPVFSEIHLFNF